MRFTDRVPRCPAVGPALALAAASAATADTFVSNDIINDPSPDAFSVCFRHTCETVVQLSLKEGDWDHIREIFSDRAKNPEQERRLIARAVARMETLIGPLTNTANDKGGNFAGFMEPGNQMDCIDESTNTTTYLRMMKSDSLLRWHSVEDRVTRGWFIFGWPHTTAVIKDLESGRSYAIDSWFFDNGMEPPILPLAVWKDGWEPEY